MICFSFSERFVFLSLNDLYFLYGRGPPRPPSLGNGSLLGPWGTFSRQQLFKYLFSQCSRITTRDLDSTIAEFTKELLLLGKKWETGGASLDRE